MSLVTNTVTAAIKAAIDAEVSSLYGAPYAAAMSDYHQAIAKGIATAMVAQIHANAVVNPGTFAVATAPGAVVGGGTIS